MDILKQGAVISQSGVYRYELYRIWDREKPKVLFIMLNPSTADHTKDDPTIRRCMDFANSWGYGGIYVCNLYAARTSDPRVLKSAHNAGVDIVGDENLKHIEESFFKTSKVIFAWGSSKPDKMAYQNHTEGIIAKYYDAECLGKNKDGSPKHPLYLKKDLKTFLFR